MLEQLKKSLIELRDKINSNPNSLYGKNSMNLIAMVNYALQYWDEPTKRDNALKILADKEIQLNKLNSKDKEFNNNEGFFTTIYEASQLGFLEDEYELGRVKRNKKPPKKKLSKEEKKAKAEKIENKLFKFNPVTVAMRNSFRVLISLNIFGFATILSSQKAKSTGVYDKVMKMYFYLGGDKDSIEKSINTGSKKPILLNKKIKDDFKKLQKGEKIDGIGLGEGFTIATLLTSASGLLIKVLSWVKKAGLDKILPQQNDNSQSENNQDNITDNNVDDQSKSKLPQIKTDNIGVNPPKSNRILKFALIGTSVLSLIAGGIYLYKKKSHKENELKGIKLN